MPSVCCYFQVHQPYRLRRFRVFDIGRARDYFDDAANREILQKVAAKCYLPANRLLLELIERHQGRFKVAFSISGTALEQLEAWSPETLRSFQELAATGCVELLAETDRHSLSFVFDREEFDTQVDRHVERIESLFGQRPRVFRNTELIFSNALARHLQQRGFRAVLAEGADRMLGWRSPCFLYASTSAPALPVLLKHYRLSDDIAFRYSNPAWEEHPLTAAKFGRWVNQLHGAGQLLNLFMDYETFGEHQWAESGIFDFLERLPAELLAHADNDFVTPSEAVARYQRVGLIDVHDFTSWADLERDLSAWLGNDMQRTAAQALYGLRPAVYRSGDPELLEAWQRLTTSDHLYYLCTKWFSDGDVHKYFNPYESPYEAYIALMNVLNDLALRVEAPARGSVLLHERPHLRAAEAVA